MNIDILHASKALMTWVILALALTACTTGNSLPLPPPSEPMAIPSVTALASPPAIQATLPTPQSPWTTTLSLVSQESLLAYLQDLTAIQAHSGWRNSATQGEAEALDYVQTRLGKFEHLHSLGLELERQTLHVFLSVESWENRLQLTVGGQNIQVAADNIRGHRDDIARALRFDSDGALNDDRRDPVEASGAPYLIRSLDDLEALTDGSLDGQIACVDFEIVSDVLWGQDQAGQRLDKVLAGRPAGLVLVTEFSDERGKSHGTFIADGSAFNRVESPHKPPTLYVRLEDLAAAGLDGWEGLASAESIRLTWDADVFSPGLSGNLVARIPGQDPTHADAVILGAHIDSPNNPGALDDGSGSALLLETARVLDAAGVQPAVDTYMVWFGSEEAGLYGSSHFAATHQELLDRTLAMLQVDMLSYPLDGIKATINLVAFPYTWWGDDRITWPDYVTQNAQRLGIPTTPISYLGMESDNSVLAGFGVPNANMIYQNKSEMERMGSIHYACHVHSPYEYVDMVRPVGGVLEQMAQVSLLTLLEIGQDKPDLRVAPRPDRRALFIASHTEAHHMAPTAFTAFGMALEMHGFDVDMIPYGQAVSQADLDEADLVVALPVIDYPSPDGDISLYDEAWEQAEIEAIEAYVADGGLLILTNSARRLKYGNMVLDPNEDWADVNALAGRFGVSYQDRPLPDEPMWLERVSPLLKNVRQIETAAANSVPFTVQTENWKLLLAKVGQEPIAALVEYGPAGGQVIALADVGILGAGWEKPANLTFWQNLIWHARSRQKDWKSAAPESVATS